MARETFAPWAQVVPGVGPMTADELLKLPADGWQYELVDGVLVRMPPPGYLHGRFTSRLARVLGTYVDQHGLGEVLHNDTGFLLSQPGQKDVVLGPDVSFVAAARMPSTDAPDIAKYQRMAPDLAAEFASPDQYRPEMADKAKLYLQAGVRLVWIVWPPTKTVDVWLPGSDAPVATLAVGDALDGREVVPGFSYMLAELFA